METKSDWICEKCNFNGKCKSAYDKHLTTNKHLHGKNKIRSDVKDPYSCNECGYTTKNASMYREHILALHSTEEERQKTFKYYCTKCKFGSFMESIFNNHLKTQKHQKMHQSTNYSSESLSLISSSSPSSLLESSTSL